VNRSLAFVAKYYDKKIPIGVIDPHIENKIVSYTHENANEVE
jgi:hypothetical protein